MKKYIIYIILILLLSTSSKAQNIILYDFDGSDYPYVSAKFMLFSKEGLWLRNLDATQIQLYENGSRKEVEVVSCPSSEKVSTLSSVVTIDRSSSMEDGGLIKAISAARSWIDLQSGDNETATTAFNHNCILLSGFSKDKEKLKSLFDLIDADGKTSFNHGFLYSPAGALRIAKKGLYSKVILFISDGEGDCDYKEVIRQANENNIRLFSVAIDNPAVDQLHLIANGTGGAVFEDVINEEDLEFVANAIQTLANKNEPCTIKWKSNDCSANRILNIVISDYGINKEIKYSVDMESLQLPFLEINPRSTVNFGRVEITQSKDESIRFTARTGDVYIENIIPALAQFSISDMNGKTFPFVLEENDNWTFKIRYDSPDLDRRVCNFDVVSDICLGSSFYAVAGVYNSNGSESIISVVYPNGGEYLIAGNTYNLLWSDSDLSSDFLSLEYTLDKGSNWNNINYLGGVGEQEWTTPIVESDECLLRVSQLSAQSIDSIEYSKSRKLNAICWSPLGGTILSGHDDQYLYKNDSYNLTKDYINRTHLSSVNAVDWSLDGNVYASASSYIRIWNNSSNSAIASLRGNDITAEFFTISLGPDANKIASNYLNELAIWDIASEQQIRTIKLNSNIVGKIDWDGISGRIAAGDDKGYIHILDPIDYSIKYSNKDHAFEIQDIAWSPDGSKLMSISGDKLRVVEASNYSEIYSNSALGNRGVGADWHPSSTKIAYALSNGKVYIYDLNKKELDTVLQAPLKEITSIRWSPTGDQLALIQKDDSSQIYIYTYIVGSSDASDAVWSIVMPELQAKDVEFALTKRNSTRDSIVVGMISNEENYPIKIDSVAIIGMDADAFQLLNKSFPLTVPANSKIDLKLRFLPIDLGVSSAELYVYYNGEQVSSKLSGQAYEDELILSTENIDFGNIAIGVNKDTVALVIALEKGDYAKISNYYLDGADTDKFFLDPMQEFELNTSNPEKELKIAYETDVEGLFSSSIVFETEQSEKKYRAWLGGSSYDVPKEGEALISLPTLSGKTSDIISIPVSVQLANDIELNEDLYFYLDIRFNKTVLYSQNETDIGRIEGEFRVIRVDSILIKQNSSTNDPYFLEFLVTLGNSVDTKLEIINSGVNSSNVDIRTSDGYFSVSNICYEGGTRLIGGGSETAILLQNYPNPVASTTKIEFVSIEKGEHRVVLYDLFGREVKTLYENTLEMDSKIEFEVDLSDLAAGYYYYILHCPNMIFKKEMIIK
jgi:von Willebrand factor type A domain-containing protein/type IX secretion system substrate protein/WD40 domain-containing protein